jgi:hypothetical protein
LSRRSQIVLVCWAAAFQVMFGISAYFLTHIVPPPPPTNGDSQIGGFFAAHATSMRFGAVLAMTATGFNLPVAAVVSHQMARLGPSVRVWAILQGMAGALVSVWLVFPALVWGVAAFTPERPPDITRTLSDLSFLSLVTTTPYYIFQVIPIIYVCLSHRVNSPYFPRWFGYFSIWSFLITEVGPLGFLTKAGPIAWNGLIVFWLPVVVFTTWFFTLCYLLITALIHDATEADVDEPLS